MQARSLYVHFPFCETKCHYCDFYSIGVRDAAARGKSMAGADAGTFETALRQEAEQSAHLLAPALDTIFLGGGTPSMTACDSARRALEPLGLDAAKAGARVTPQTEWTMEANPSSINLATMRAYRAFGVNRISMGVQALQEHHLKNLGRVHSRDDAFRALDAVFEAGFTNVSCDLLCGVPGQTIDELESSLTALLERPITHLSCYLLTLAPHHAMYKQLPSEDTQLEHLLALDQFMRTRGFEHYEVSNFAKPGLRARHNLAYWKGESYLGLGPSAHSYDATAGIRFKSVSSLRKYAELLGAGQSPHEQKEILTPEQRVLERWMLALRLNEGFPEAWLETRLQKDRAQTFRAAGWIETHPERANYLRLTPRGFPLSDTLVSQLATAGT